MINVQTREITDNLTSLVKQIDSLANDAGALGRDTKHAFVVLITDDPDDAESKLTALADEHQIKNTPLTIFDVNSGPRGYKIAKKAEVTVMMWAGQSVKVNHAFAAGELDVDAVKQIMADAKKHLE